jgi:hypothetical protein
MHGNRPPNESILMRQDASTGVVYYWSAKNS